MNNHNLESSRAISSNKDITKEILSRFDLVSSILLLLTGFVLMYFNPFLGYLIRRIASDAGYGSAKLFYFFVVDFEFFLTLGVIFLLINGFLLFLAGLGIKKYGKWIVIIHYLSWTMILLIFPIGTLYSAFVLWMTLKIKQ